MRSPCLFESTCCSLRRTAAFPDKPPLQNTRSLQPNHKPEEDPSHVSRNCNPIRRCGKTGSLQQMPMLLSTKLASSAHFCMVASHGQHMQHKSASRSLPPPMSTSSSGSILARQVTHNEMLDRDSIPSMYTLLRQCRLRWLGYVHRMRGGHVPKYLLYRELATGYRNKGRPHLRYIYV